MKDPMFIKDFYHGGIAGIVAGAVVGPIEYMKVMRQTTEPELWRGKMKQPETYIKMGKNLITFSPIFGSVCAVEFSINERVKKNYGNIAGIVASSFTGSFFLTPADHLMFRADKGQKTWNAVKQMLTVSKRAPWTGFTTMIGRESIFIASVLHLGPATGEYLRMLAGEPEETSLKWSSYGRMLAGIPTSILSQPLDVITRKMQLQLYSNPTVTPKFQESFRMLAADYKESASKFKHPLFRGILFRMPLATMGGVIAGGLFEYFSKLF